MTATAEYNPSTNILTVTGDGLPTPVAYGTFPNANNPNTVTEQAFEHDFFFRGGTFGIARTFDDNTWSKEGYVITIPLSPDDNTLLSADPFSGTIRPGDNLLFVFSDGRKQKFVYQGTTFTSTPGNCWRSTDTTLDLIVADSSYGDTGTYTYYDQRNGRTPTPLGIIGVSSNGVALFNPSAGAGGNPPTGFNWNAHYELSPVEFGDDQCGGHPENTGQYHYHDTHFIDCWKEDSIMSTYNDYYGLTQYNGDNLRHPDGHSKMLGIAFDGFPVYGPFAYSDPWDNESEITNMTTSYDLKPIEPEGRPSYGSTLQNPPAGSFMQDWEYNEGQGSLDYHNGRFCLTPEYPNGTYAYFLTVDETGEAQFPYMIGLTSRQSIDQPPNNGAAAPPDPGAGGEGPGGVAPTLQINTQPQNVTLNSGQVATFSVSATILPENGPKTYQWFRSTDGGFSYSTLNGATSSSYSFTALSYMTGYKFKVEIRGPIGAPAPAQNSPLTSDVATLTVTGVGGATGDTQFDATATTFDSTSTRFDQT
jgi:hypothetical protein